MTAESKTESPAVPHTEAMYGYLTRAFDFFNRKHWDGKLPPALIIPHRNPRAFGYYHKGIFARFEAEKMLGKVDELALNPQYVATRAPKDVLSTLVHEMVHHWQSHFDKPPSHAYHNKQWGVEMKRVGLYPSSTGKPGGKEVGQCVSHYVLEGGPFDIACNEFLAAEPPVFFQDRAAMVRAGMSAGGEDDDGGGGGEDEGEDNAPKKSKGRAKFVCPKCNLNAWAKPSAVLVCGIDGIQMECEDAEAD